MLSLCRQTDKGKTICPNPLIWVHKNAGKQHFLLFPQFLQTFPKQSTVFSVTFFTPSANALNLDHSKLLSFGTGLTRTMTPFKVPGKQAF